MRFPIIFFGFSVFLACSSSPERTGPTSPPTTPSTTGGACPAKDAAAWLAKPGTTHDATLGASETWKAADSPHRLPQGLEIEDDKTLTIEPCALVVVGSEADKGRAIHVGAAEPAPAKGDLVAVGSADQPIAFRGDWEGIAFFGAIGKSRLSYVTIENAGGARGSGGVDLHSALWLTHATTSVTVDHTTIRGGAMDGLRVDGDAMLGPGSEANTITGVAGAPIVADFFAVDSIRDGSYTGNGTDRVELEPDEGPSANATWRKLSVPWHLRGPDFMTIRVTVTVEPGTHVIVEKNDNDARYEGTFVLAKGGAIVADGKSGAGTIVFEGETADPPGSWHGFELLADAGKSTFNFVKIAQAGRMLDTESSLHCEDPALENTRSAVKLHAKGLVTITNTEIRDVGAKAYAVEREYCAGATAEFTPTNKFTGAILCGQTDTKPCNAVCAPEKTCCDHDYACEAPPTP
jgi:hypothetical protein